MTVTLEEQKIRAKVDGPFGVIRTPYVLSFYVSKNRNQLDSFNCSLKIKGGESSDYGGGKNTIKIYAGLKSANIEGAASELPKIYEGYITSVSIRPCFEDPEYHIVDLSGTDARKFLEGKVVSRRQLKQEKSWVEITSVNRRGIKSSKLQYTRKSEFADSSFPTLDKDVLDNLQQSAADYLNKEAKIDVDDTGKRGFLDFKVVYESTK